MKHIRLEGNVRLVGIKENGKGRNRNAFSRNYSRHTYDLCKAGIRVNDLVSRRTRDTAVMNLVDYTNLMLPYFVEIYGLPSKKA